MDSYYRTNQKEGKGARNSQDKSARELTWENILEDATKGLGLTLERFFELTWYEFNNLWRHKVSLHEEQLEQTRLIVSAVYNSRMGIKEHQWLKPQDILQLSFDEDAESRIMQYSDEEIDKELEGLETLFDRFRPYENKPNTA